MKNLLATALLGMIALGPAARDGIARAQQPPATGRDLLVAMNRAYSGRWYTTLTFTQKTTTRAADGTQSVTTWYESVRQSPDRGTQLRIDVGDPATGNGVLYSADSLWIMRGGKLATARKGGNALLPLIEGVYLQPAERTAAELMQTGVDLSRAVVTGRWNDRTVWIAGASSAADTVSPQFWIDVQRLIVVRAIFAPAPGSPKMDMHFDGIVPLSGGWLATKCSFYTNGSLVQMEEYGDWRANVTLSPGLFDVGTWSSAPHWVPKPPAPPGFAS